MITSSFCKVTNLDIEVLYVHVVSTMENLQVVSSNKQYSCTCSDPFSFSFFFSLIQPYHVQMFSYKSVITSETELVCICWSRGIVDESLGHENFFLNFHTKNTTFNAILTLPTLKYLHEIHYLQYVTLLSLLTQCLHYTYNAIFTLLTLLY